MNEQPTAGEGLKAVQTGALPIGTVEQILKRAPSDIVTEVLEIPEWGYSVKVRSFTSAQNASVKQHGLVMRQDGRGEIVWAEMEIHQFLEGVVEPQFSKEQVRQLHNSSGAGFQRVINWLDEKSGTDKEAIRKARDEFPVVAESSED